MIDKERSIIEKTQTFVKNTLKDTESGHDWWHVYRVYNLTKTIAKVELCNNFVAEMAALLHDIADSKFYDGNEEIGPQMAKEYLEGHDIENDIIDQIIKIVQHISFKGGNFEKQYSSKELEVVQDADRLDAMGAIGIARTFNYGGFKNRSIYDPEIKPNLKMTKEEYKNSIAPTINHFYEKLLLLQDKMNTNTGKNLARMRHKFMEDYLQQFYKEWEGEL